MYQSLLSPVIVLIVWTLIVWLIMYARRIPAMNKAGIKPDDARHPGSLDVLPAGVRAAADNYNHLLEQPTIFYALAFWLYLKMETGGGASDFTIGLAWGYVAVRIAHSLVQLMVGPVALRFALFVVSSLSLFGLAGVAVGLTLAG